MSKEMLSQVGFLEADSEMIYYRNVLRRRGEGRVREQDETGKLLSKKVVLAGLFLRPDSMSCFGA